VPVSAGSSSVREPGSAAETVRAESARSGPVVDGRLHASLPRLSGASTSWKPTDAELVVGAPAEAGHAGAVVDPHADALGRHDERLGGRLGLRRLGGVGGDVAAQQVELLAHLRLVEQDDRLPLAVAVDVRDRARC
jgi:hypothetical protein